MNVVASWVSGLVFVTIFFLANAAFLIDEQMARDGLLVLAVAGPASFAAYKFMTSEESNVKR